MGEIKLDARHIMLGTGKKMFAAFFICVFFTALAGNLPLLLEKLLNIRTVSGYLESLRDGLTDALRLVCAVISLCIFLVTSASLRMGREYRFYLLARGEGAGARTVLYFFAPKRILRSLAAWLLYSGIRVRRFILFQLPCLAVTAGLYYTVSSGFRYIAPCAALAVCAAALFICGAFFSMVCGGAELPFFTLVLKFPDMGVLQAMRLSHSMMDGELKRAALFKLSFAPWYLLCVFIIPSFYVWSYYKQSLAVLVAKSLGA